MCMRVVRFGRVQMRVVRFECVRMRVVRFECVCRVRPRAFDYCPPFRFEVSQKMAEIDVKQMA